MYFVDILNTQLFTIYKFIAIFINFEKIYSYNNILQK